MLALRSKLLGIALDPTSPKEEDQSRPFIGGFVPGRVVDIDLQFRFPDRFVEPGFQLLLCVHIFAQSGMGQRGQRKNGKECGWVHHDFGSRLDDHFSESDSMR